MRKLAAEGKFRTLNIYQNVEETQEWPEEEVAELIDRVFRARYGTIASDVDLAWHDEIQRRIVDLESGRVEGIPLEETLVRVRK